MNQKTNNFLNEGFFCFFEIESDWKRTRFKPSSKQLMEIFPHAVPIIREKICEWEEVREAFRENIKRKLLEIRRGGLDDFASWFWREWIKQTDGKKLIEAERHLKRLKHLLWLKKDRGRHSKGWIEEEQKALALLVPIESLLQTEYRTGRKTIRALCPFHEERTPSFHIYSEQNRFKCFGCGRGGDAINFIQEFHNLSFRDAINYLIQK